MLKNHGLSLTAEHRQANHKPLLLPDQVYLASPMVSRLHWGQDRMGTQFTAITPWPDFRVYPSSTIS